MLPAVTIAALLTAASAGTYAIVRVHDRTAAAAALALGGGDPDPASARQPVPRPPARRDPVPRLTPLPRPAPLPRRQPAPAVSPARSTEQAELGQLAALLRRSATVRATLTATTHAVAACQLRPRTGLARIQDVIVDRAGLLASAAQAPVAAIPGGSALSAELVAALRFSLAADSQFANWAGSLPGSCPVPTLSSSPFQAALTDSALANAAKAELLLRWNPLAAGAGLPSFRSSQI